ncbi:PREDICTED: uncharacterized protein LOC108369299 [Rhagoletis zephyria]|uniref:uncharacterized protein LOC108369299 n=1 Tax=Rhagoletis zephyria TaxID=28612 RepID=UPI0008119BD6|nr:PREDICTED: uncharacterized protein LOC108369299 [Rhagoletis zephyria]
MDSVAIWLEADEGQVAERVQLRALRDKANIFTLNDKCFTQNFRLNKQAFRYVLNAITPELSTPRKSTAIPPIIKLAAALKLLGQGGYQHQIGQDQHVGLSQQSIRICKY